MTVTWDGDAAKIAVALGIREGLGAAGEHVLEESNKLVPRLTGALEDSGAVTPFTETSVMVSYSRHPIRAHEDLTFHHKHGQAKYLETALTSTEDEALGIIAAAVEEHLG